MKIELLTTHEAIEEAHNEISEFAKDLRHIVEHSTGNQKTVRMYIANTLKCLANNIINEVYKV